MRKKNIRFEANKQLENLIEPGKPLYTTSQGIWNTHYFCNQNPITLEIGCGHGTYTIELATLFAEKNFIGIDVKGDRLWKGAHHAKEAQLTNVAFLRIQVENLLDFFAENEIANIWLTFPDPRPKNREQKRRLTSMRFLELYQKILARNGRVHLKTDSMQLFDYTLNLLQDQKLQVWTHTTDLYNSHYLNETLNIQTVYETKFLQQNIPIKYLCFSFDH